MRETKKWGRRGYLLLGTQLFVNGFFLFNAGLGIESMQDYYSWQCLSGCRYLFWQCGKNVCGVGGYVVSILEILKKGRVDLSLS